MYRRAKSITSKRPNVLVSDGAPNFNQAFRYEFFTKRSPRSHHIHLRLHGGHNSNKMERFNGEVRGGEKVMRGLKKSSDSKNLDGYQVYHNYIRPNQGFGIATPVTTKYMPIMIDMTPITIFKFPPDSDPLLSI